MNRLLVAISLSVLLTACNGLVAGGPSTDGSGSSSSNGSESGGDSGNIPPGRITPGGPTGTSGFGSTSRSTRPPSTRPPSTTPPPELLAIDASITQIQLKQEVLGYPPDKGDGSCTINSTQTMIYDRATKAATWHFCGTDNMFGDSARALTASEAAQIESLLSVITYIENPPCEGYDGMLKSMTTSTVDGTETLYAEANINCYPNRRVAPKLVAVYNALASMK